uniref:Uncharacterized protein n=1 Tax=Acrobeloides nanus TaxID=290746 RepID=A0A914DUW3_9BILA
MAALPGLSFIFSLLLTIKIRKSSNHLKKSFVNNSYDDLKRAFIYCLIQSLMEMVYFGLILYQLIVPKMALWKISIPGIVARIFIANAVLIDIVNVGFNMVESLMMIFLLKMYRNVILDGFKKLKNLLKRTSVQPVGG